MGGGGQDNAQKAAERRERETEARILQNTQRVNSIFDDPKRQAQIADFTNAARALYREELDRQKGDTDRNLTFALARSGQTGGSLETDQRTNVGEDYQKGLVKSEQSAQGDAANLRAADESSRAQLLSMVQSGGDIGTAASNSATQLRNNLLQSQAGVNAEAFGDAFSRIGDVFNRSKQQAEYRRGLFDYQNLYTPTYGFGGNGGP